MRSLGLGAATIGGLHGPVDEGDALATLQAAWACGIRRFDVAPLYGAGRAERLLGQFLRGQPRASFTLTTKVGWQVQDGRCVIDYSHDGVLRALEASLCRLGLDRVDAAFIHDLDRYNHGAEFSARFEQAMRGALPALARVRLDGRAGSIGLAVNDPAVCVAALDHGDFDVVLIAGRYTLIDQAAADVLLPVCLERGMKIIVGAPFNTGVLAGAARFRHRAVPDAILDRVEALRRVCRDFSIDLPAAALQFPLRHPSVIGVLAGAGNPGQVRQCAAWHDQVIPETFWRRLEDLHLLTNVAEPIA